jgi:hypothetical protein
MSMTDVRGRFSDTMARADEVLAERLRREKAQLERERQQEEAEARAQARADAERRSQYQDRYDSAFAAFGTQTPQPAADESPGAYRKRLFENLRRRLPSGNEWASVRADDIPPSARANIEALVIEAAKAEGERPSFDGLPRDGSLIARNRVDSATGEKSVEYFGRESFIKSLGRPTRKVLRLIGPGGRILLGREWSLPNA